MQQVQSAIDGKSENHRIRKLEQDTDENNEKTCMSANIMNSDKKKIMKIDSRCMMRKTMEGMVFEK